MPLTKPQAVALYTLLSTDSALVKTLATTTYADADKFADALKKEANLIHLAAGGAAMDFTEEVHLVNLFCGLAGAAPKIPRDAHVIKSNIVALSALYAGGACPKGDEQAKIWKAILNSGI